MGSQREEKIRFESDSRDHKNAFIIRKKVAGGSSRSIEICLFRDASKYTYESGLQGAGTNALLKNNQPESLLREREKKDRSYWQENCLGKQYQGKRAWIGCPLGCSKPPSWTSSIYFRQKVWDSKCALMRQGKTSKCVFYVTWIFRSILHQSLICLHSA